METNDEKIKKKLQRFLRLVALRGGIEHAKVMALIVRKGKIAVRNGSVPTAEVMDWDLDEALQRLSQRLCARFIKASYLGFHDVGGVRHYAFDVEAEPAPEARFVEVEELGGQLRDEERRIVLTALRRREAGGPGLGQ